MQTKHEQRAKMISLAAEKLKVAKKSAKIKAKLAAKEVYNTVYNEEIKLSSAEYYAALHQKMPNSPTIEELLATMEPEEDYDDEYNS